MTEVVVNGLDVFYLREGHRVSDHGGGTRSGASCRLELVRRRRCIGAMRTLVAATLSGRYRLGGICAAAGLDWTVRYRAQVARFEIS